MWMLISFTGNILIVGFGAIGQALLVPLMTHLDLKSKQIRVIAADGEGQAITRQFAVSHQILPLIQQNFDESLAKYLNPGDLLINVSVEVSSLALIKWCQQNDVMYLDTCVEPWAGGYQSSEVSECTNYALRLQALSAFKKGTATAVIAHGANPGLVSHFIKKGLENLAADAGINSWNSYADLSNRLGIKVIQIAERDTQSISEEMKPQVFYNTWSVPGLIAEAKQLAELSWGTHERALHSLTRQHKHGDQSGIYLAQESVKTRVKSWVPSIGKQESYLITHHEALSIANFLTIHDNKAGWLYRPTVYFAYNPCEVARNSIDEWVANEFAKPADIRVICDEISEGFDELGVLFIFDKGAYWYGSTLGIDEARSLAPFNNATTLQVVAGILGAVVWMLDNPKASVVEAEYLDHEQVMHIAMPFLGSVRGVYTDWQPKKGSKLQFEDFIVKK